MRFVVIPRLLLCLAVILSCGVLIARGTIHPRSTNASLRRIELYTYNYVRSGTSLDVKNGELTLISMKPSRAGPKWVIARARVDASDLQRIEAASGIRRLRFFAPKATWFRKSVPPPDSGSVLKMTWQDRHRSFAVPSRTMRASVPHPGKVRYADMDVLVERICDVRSRCLGDAEHVSIAEGDARFKRYAAESDHALEDSLPPHRIGW